MNLDLRVMRPVPIVLVVTIGVSRGLIHLSTWTLWARQPYGQARVS